MLGLKLWHVSKRGPRAMFQLKTFLCVDSYKRDMIWPSNHLMPFSVLCVTHVLNLWLLCSRHYHVILNHTIARNFSYTLCTSPFNGYIPMQPSTCMASEVAKTDHAEYKTTASFTILLWEAFTITLKASNFFNKIVFVFALRKLHGTDMVSSGDFHIKNI